MSRSDLFRSFALVVMGVLGFAAAAPAAQISANLHASWVAGSDFSSGSEVRVVLRSGPRTVKAVATESISGGGWWLSFGAAPVTIGAGDTLEVLVDGTSIGAMGVPGIVADTNPDTDVTSGRIVAAPGAALPARVELGLYLVRLVAAPAPGREETWADATAKVGADGRFRKSWNSGAEPRDLWRNDELTARVSLAGPGGHVWNFNLPAPVTGMSIYEGLGSVGLKGAVTSVHGLDLTTARGALRARTGLTLLDPGTGAAFFTRDAAQVPIVPGYVVKLGGAAAHEVRVPKLTGAVSAAADQVKGLTLPAVVVEAALTHGPNDSPTRAYAKSDARGAYAITFPEDVVPGDLVEVRIQLRTGTWIVRRLPVAP